MAVAGERDYQQTVARDVQIRQAVLARVRAVPEAFSVSDHTSIEAWAAHRTDAIIMPTRGSKALFTSFLVEETQKQAALTPHRWFPMRQSRGHHHRHPPSPAGISTCLDSVYSLIRSLSFYKSVAKLNTQRPVLEVAHPLPERSDFFAKTLVVQLRMVGGQDLPEVRDFFTSPVHIMARNDALISRRPQASATRTRRENTPESEHFKPTMD